MTNTTITLDQPTASGPPAANLRNPGASVVVGIVNVADYQQRNFDTKEPEFWDDGKPKMGKVITGIVVTATDTTCGTDDAAPPAAPGDLVTFWCEKGKHFTWRDAVRAHGAVSPGDVMRWERLEDEPPARRGMHPQKVYKATLRAPEARDGDLPERCVAAYYDAQQRPVVDAPAAAAAPAVGDVF